MTSRSASRSDRITAALEGALSPQSLTVEDQSARHAGHAGARPEGETHFAVTVVAAAFAGKSRLARQRLVMEVLKGEFDSGLHALAIAARAPGEI